MVLIRPILNCTSLQNVKFVSMKRIYAVQEIEANDVFAMCSKINRIITSKERVVSVLKTIPTRSASFRYKYYVLFEYTSLNED